MKVLSSFDFNGTSRATGLPVPAAASEAATKGYVDSLVGGIGSTTADFGTFPGSSLVTIVVAGQTSILVGSVPQAWVAARATAQHSVDEHALSTLNVTTGNVIAGVGFSIYVYFADVETPYGTYAIDWKWQ